MKKTALIVFLLSGCTVSNRHSTVTVVLDGSKSRVIGGDGTGFVRMWKWRQLKGQPSVILNSSAMITETSVDASCDCEWELTGMDNLGNVQADTLYFKGGKLSY